MSMAVMKANTKRKNKNHQGKRRDRTCSFWMYRSGHNINWANTKGLDRRRLLLEEEK